jgi:hypothetical protein
MSVIKAAKVMHPDSEEGGLVLGQDGRVAIFGGDGEDLVEFATESYVDSEVFSVFDSLQNFQSDVNSRTSDDFAEGTSNLYYTDARADGRIAAAEFDASKTTTGQFNSDRIPDLDASKTTSGTFNAARIPTLDASKTTSGTFNAARIPALDASKTTSGTFNAARIPALDASKIASGTIDPGRLPPIGAAFTNSGSNSVAVSFDQDRIINREATGTVTFTGSNYTAGKSATIRINPGASNRSLSFPAGWRFLSIKPTTANANKIGVLTLTSFGTTEAGVVAAWGDEI